MSALPAAVLDDLLTVDEARTAVVRSSLRCLTNATCNPIGMVAMLWGLPAGPTWSRSDALLASAQRLVLDSVASCGHDWVIATELEGILSATGLDEGLFSGADPLIAALERPDLEEDLGALGEGSSVPWRHLERTRRVARRPGPGRPLATSTEARRGRPRR